MMIDFEKILEKLLKTERKIELTLETTETGIKIEWDKEESNPETADNQTNQH